MYSNLFLLKGGFQCLLDKVKSDTQAAKDVTLFLKKRAAIEEEYGKQMIKLAQSMSESFDKGHLNLRYISKLYIYTYIYTC